MNSLLLTIVAGACVVLAIVFAIFAMRGSASEGQQVLLRVTRDAGRTKVVGSNAGAKDRIVVPLMTAMGKVGLRLTPPGRMAKLEEKLDLAGHPNNWTATQFLAIKALFIPVAVVFYLTFGLGPFNMILFKVPILALILFFASPVIGWYLPDYWLSKQAVKRSVRIRRQLADMVDMLNLTLAAGIGFDSSLRLVAMNTKGPLSEEFSRVVQEVAIGKSRTEALRALADRTGDDDLRRFCMACIQADRRGTPLGEILALQSKELRIKRRQDAEERAQKVPVKILFPMMVFVLPVLMGVTLGPAIFSIIDGMGA